MCLWRAELYSCQSTLRRITQMLGEISKAKLNFMPFCSKRATEKVAPVHHGHQGWEKIEFKLIVIKNMLYS